MVPRLWKAAPSSNLFMHQGRCGQLFRLFTAQGAMSKGMLLALWTSLFIKKNLFVFLL